MDRLASRFRLRTTIHFGCEKHFKSCVDRLFGWCRGCLRRWLDKKTDILTIEHLVSALQHENQLANGGAKVQCLRDESPVPTAPVLLNAAKLKISHTYCLSSVASRLRAEPRISNRIFSTRPTSVEVDYSVVQGDVPHWRPGFFGAGQRAWCPMPP